MEDLSYDIDYISLAEAAYSSVQNFLKLLYQEIIEWDDLDDSDKHFYVRLTKYILDNFKKVEPRDLHVA
jgi:hypothetical protein